ncbi:NAD/NADP octopine/nopaline dehydrogenase family protein (plasmid) [Salipiger sp. H15]|uniref:NAD/NADP octopine/nopaline dehydrogenase family protein n=1 Tax=Alloyangia sp. H15 TaxID=3029062 RepID=A0AAU8AQ05_9RHOB
MSLSVGIAGAGSIAFGTAAVLESRGHRTALWSPSGTGTDGLGQGLTASGALSGVFHPEVAGSAEALVTGRDVVLIAVPGYGHKAVMDAIAPHLSAGQQVIVSSHASFGAVYLSELLAARGLTLPVTAWGTTALTGRRTGPAACNVNTIRAKIDMCTVPASAQDGALETCRTLFGDVFVARDGLLAIALSNLNPQNHMGIALGNMTRMEHGETWSQAGNVTPNVGRLMEALDEERLNIARALGLSVKTIFEHYHQSYHVPVASIHEMNAALVEAGTGGQGPATADSRYVTEDVPYGLVPTVVLGDLIGLPAELHRSGVKLFSAMYGRDFEEENELLAALPLAELSLDQMREVALSGRLPGPETLRASAG